jgi:hypothetical protein
MATYYDMTEPERDAIQADLYRLITLGLVDLDPEGQPVWTEAAWDAYHKVNGQTWS